MAGDRTERATPQRREKARKEGDLVHSRELCAATGTLAGVMLLGMASTQFLTGWRAALASFLAYGKAVDWEMATVDVTLRSLVRLTLSVLAPVGMVAAAVVTGALAAGVLQTGGLQVHPQVLAWKFSRLNPVTNLQNLFSLRALARLGKSMIPAALLAIFAVQRMGQQAEIPPFSTIRMVSLGGDVYDLLLAASWLLFAWALVDYVVEWRSREQRLRMSRQEMREEFKESEGNPQIRGRIRNLQRAARRRRMRADVSKAAVVVTNPTHYAVALEFNFETMDAPKVLAKGRNLIAEEIKEEARWAGVPILENPPLARSLYRSVEPGEAIPVELYAAVASILAFLYKQRVEEQMRSRRERAGANRQSAERQTGGLGSSVAPVIRRARTGQLSRRAATKGNAVKGSPLEQDGEKS